MENKLTSLTQHHSGALAILGEVREVAWLSATAAILSLGAVGIAVLAAILLSA